MKKTKLFFLFIMMLFVNTSCSDNNSDVIWDFVNYSIEFNVSNNDLLNDEAFLSKVKIVYEGKEYHYSKEDSEHFYTRATYCYPLAIRCYSNSLDQTVPNTILGFGEFSPTEDYKNQKFTIDWGNGRVDEVEFDLYITWKKGDPTVHKKLKLNGEERDFSPLLIPLN
ncbi:MAG: putative lipoprotein [Bacteroidetes bacterium]|nr:putative lipoprotein [Bacteroidota bacterium]